MIDDDPKPISDEERKDLQGLIFNTLAVWGFILFACIAPILLASGIYGLLVGFGGEKGAALMLAVGLCFIVVQAVIVNFTRKG